MNQKAPSSSLAFLASQRGSVICKCSTQFCIIKDIKADEMVERYGGDETLAGLAERLVCPKCKGPMAFEGMIPWNDEEKMWGVKR